MKQTLDELDFDRGLWGACSRGDLDRVTGLLNERKRDPNERDLSGYTPLHYAARLGHDHVCSLLLRKKADVDLLAGESSATPLHRACGASHVEVFRRCCGQLARRHVVCPAFCADDSSSAYLRHQVAKLLLQHGSRPALQVRTAGGNRPSRSPLPKRH